MHPLPDELNLRNDMRDLIMQRPLSDLQFPRSVLTCTRLSSPRAGERAPLWSRSSLRGLAEALATRYAVEGSRAWIDAASQPDNPQQVFLIYASMNTEIAGLSNLSSADETKVRRVERL